MIHNAGVNCVGPIERCRPEHLEQVVRVNLLAPLLLTRDRLGRRPQVRRLAFVSSLSHFTGYPGAAAYAATKTALAAYARSLAVEFSDRGVGVTTVYPGPTRTTHARRYSLTPDKEAARMPAGRVARAILKGMLAGRRSVIPGG